ncbi:MAG: glycosyltransferase family 39 protein [Candidatus Pacearchaeota archaeon]|nr:glycosyltransferase family 39 protein [Candidatus Pacearchaeota archaeon]
MRYKRLLNSKLFWLAIIFFISFSIYAILFNQFNDIWWDEASYIGTAKFIFSGGKEGVFEPMRPILLVFLMGIFYKLGVDMILFGKLLIFLLSFFTIIFCYLIGKELFNEKIAFIGSLILLVNSMFFVFMYRIYTEMLSMCFILGSIFFMIKLAKTNKKVFVFLSAFFCALAFLSKYPNVLLAVILNIFLAYYSYKEKKFREIIFFNLFFAIFASFFLIFGEVFGGEPLFFWNASQNYFKENLGHLYDLRAFPGIPKTFFTTTDFIYFKTILYLFNILVPFIFVGLWKISKEKNNFAERVIVLILPTILFFIFYQIFYLKQDRYIMLVFPFLALFSAFGLCGLEKWKKIFVIAIYVTISLILVSIVLNFSNNEIAYWKFFSNPPINLSCERVATSDPRTLIRYNNVVFPYEVFDKTWKGGYLKKENPDCIFYFSCYDKRDEQIKLIKEFGYVEKYKKDNGRCVYAIFKK